MVPTLLRTNKLSAKLLLKKLNGTEFEEILRTETVHGVSSPQFTKRAELAPLQMLNSQRYAISSVFRLEVIVNSIVHTAVEFSLAELLWDRLFETPMTPYVSTLGKASRYGGMIFVNVVRGAQIENPPNAHKVTFFIRTSNSLWKRVVESKIRVAISAVAEKGRWSRIYFTEALRRPFGRKSSLGFPPISLDRGELTAYNPNNPIRIQLYGVRTGNQVLLGFSQFVLAELFTHDRLSWVKTEHSYLHTEIKVRKVISYENCSAAEINIGDWNARRSTSAKQFSQETIDHNNFMSEDDFNAMTGSESAQLDTPKVLGSSSGTISEYCTGKVNRAREVVHFPGDEDECYDEDTDYSEDTGDLNMRAREA